MGSIFEQQQQQQQQQQDDDKEVTRWVRDSSVDHKGSTPLRSSTGVWRASFFILTIEFSERVSYFGIATNLISYFTKVMRQDLGSAAKNVNYWAGATTVMPLFGAFFADAYVGRFPMVLWSSILYLIGLGLLTTTQYIPSIRPCGTQDTCSKSSTAHDIAFFTAAYLVSVASGGFKPCLESFGADQFDDNHPWEKRQKSSFFNWWSASLCLGLILGVTAIVYTEDNVDWGAAFAVLTVLMALMIIVFYVGRRFYRYRAAAKRSPFTPMLRVLVAALAKRGLPSPSSGEMYEVLDADGRRLCHTKRLSFLDKAAIITEEKDKENPWKLSTITQVEETKLIIALIPIWLTSMIIGVNISQSTTFFVKQAAVMNRSLSPTFQIPAASIYALTGLGMIISVTLYDRLLLRHVTPTVLVRIGIGMSISAFSMVIAALVERQRINATVLSVAWLAPQFLVLGVGEGFVLVGLQQYFYEEVPDSMRSLGMGLYLSVIGIGTFLSNFIIWVVDGVTKREGGSGWIGKDVLHSRLDRFYWVLAVINLVNLVVFVVFARKYTYKSVRRSGDGVEASLTA